MATGWPDELRRSSPFLGSSFGPAERRRARENAQRVIALKHSSCSPYVTEEVCRCSRSRSYGMASEFVRKNYWNHCPRREERRCLPKKVGRAAGQHSEEECRRSLFESAGAL